MDYGITRNAHQSLDILIIDDDLPTCSFLTTLLTAAQYTVMDTQRGSNAFRLIKHYQPRLVLIDIHMPDWNGLEFACSLRLRGDLPQPSIIMMSAQSTIMNLPDPAWAYVQKPFDIIELLHHIDMMLYAPALANGRWAWKGT